MLLCYLLQKDIFEIEMHIDLGVPQLDVILRHCLEISWCMYNRVILVSSFLMIHLFLLGLFFCRVCSQMDNLVTVHTSNITKQFPYSYTTLGNPPKTTLHANTIILSKHNFTEDCSFSPTLNKTILKGKIALVESLPEWLYCVSTSQARPTALGRIFQQEKGLGVIMLAHEKVYLHFLYFHLIRLVNIKKKWYI